MSDSIEDTKCCPTCFGCQKAINLIEYYSQCQKEKKERCFFDNRDDGRHVDNYLLWSFGDKPKCQVFSTTSNYTSLESISDGDPYILAYIDLYAPKDVITGIYGSYKSDPF